MEPKQEFVDYDSHAGGSLIMGSDHDPAIPCDKSPERLVDAIKRILSLSRLAYEEGLFQQSVNAADSALNFCTRSKLSRNRSLRLEIHRRIAIATSKLGHLSRSCRHWRLVVEILDGEFMGIENSANQDYITSLDSLADVLQKQGDKQELENVLQRLVSLYKDIGPSNKIRLAEIYSSLSDINAESNRFTQAIQNEECSLDMRVAAVGPNHKDVAACLLRIGSLRLRMLDTGVRTETLLLHAWQILKPTKDKAEARDTVDDSDVVKKNAEGIHVHVAVLSELTHLYQYRGDCVKAEEWLAKQVNLLRKTAPMRHAKALYCRQLVAAEWRLAQLIRQRGDVEGARDKRVCLLDYLHSLRGAHVAHAKCLKAHSELCVKDLVSIF